MRVGQDRHEIGSLIFDYCFPGASTLPLAVAATGSSKALPAVWREHFSIDRSHIDVPDPNDNGRTLTLVFNDNQEKCCSLNIQFLSKDKMDIDAAYRRIKDHLDAKIGKPAREMGNLIVFSWMLPDGRKVELSRFRNESGLAEMRMNTR